MAEPLLNLNTIIERPVIAINRVKYEILHPDELSVVDSVRFQNWGQRVDELIKMSDLDDDSADELTGLIQKLTDRIMDGVPEKARAKLTESQRLQVAEVFMKIPRGRKPTRKGKRATRSNGEKPVPGSSDSTAAIPPVG
jgi:hypothetical protein